MHPTHLHTAALALVLAVPAVVSAQPAIQPGWWEVEHTLKSNSGELEQAVAAARRELATMPPEQRKMMEAMLAKQGVAMGAGGPPHVFTCISPEMAASRLLPVQQDGDCTTTVTERKGASIAMRFVCSNPPSSGTGQFTVQDARRYTGRWTIVEAAAKGRAAEQVDIDIRARWVAATCAGGNTGGGAGASSGTSGTSGSSRTGGDAARTGGPLPAARP